MKQKTVRVLKWLPVIITAIAAAVVVPTVVAKIMSEWHSARSHSGAELAKPTANQPPVVEQPE